MWKGKSPIQKINADTVAINLFAMQQKEHHCLGQITARDIRKAFIRAPIVG